MSLVEGLSLGDSICIILVQELILGDFRFVFLREIINYQYIVPLSESPLSETSLYITCFIVCLTCLSIIYSLIV